MLTKLLSRMGYVPKTTAPPPARKRSNGAGVRMAIAKSAETKATDKYKFPVKPPEIFANVTPAGVNPLVAADSTIYTLANQSYYGSGFPGYAYLSSLSTRAEFRAMAAGMATELTREWIELTSSEDDDEKTKEKLPLILKELERHNVQGVIQKAVEHDCYFGRAQVFIDIRGAERGDPLILDKRTIAKGSFLGVKAVEAMWTTPSAYNALDPAAPDFYCPAKWYMLGKEVHASRMVTVISRPVPDMLKPAFNFGGISLSQLAEPYVDNWLRTRQSVSDLLNNFSITALATSMDEVLSGDDDGEASSALFDRATLFTATRSNRGMMLLDKEREELVQINTPLSGLHELQAQSQEQMCAVSRMPAIVLTGISPGGLNASSDSEIRVFYDWIAAQQSAYWRGPIDTILKVIQLSLFGEIDEDISFSFRPLYQMTPDQEATIRKTNSEAATAYINAGVIDPSEERQRLASDPASGYTGLDMDVEIVPPTEPDPSEGDPDETDDDEPPPKDKEKKPPAKDSAEELNIFMRLYADAHGIALDEWEEGKHPRADNGQFGSGGGGASPKALAGASEKTGAKSSPKAGQHFVAYRLADREGLASRNAGNANAVANHVRNAQDPTHAAQTGNAPTHVFAYRVTPEHDVDGEYQGASHKSQIDGEKIGRVDNGKGVSYSFPEKGYSSELLGAVSLEDLKAMANGKDFDDIGTNAGADLLRGHFEKFHYDHAADLSPEDRSIERRLGDKIASDPAAAVAEYNTFKDSEGGKVLNVDTARELSPDYMKDRTKSGAVHEPASQFIKDRYAEMLAQPAGPGEEDAVLFTAGGTGAGKSTAINNIPSVSALKTKAQIVFDTNMNTYDSAKKKIDQAIAAGKRINIVYVARDPADAMTHGALPRAERQREEFGSGRTVPLADHIGTHLGSIETVKRLAKEYEGDPDVKIQIIDNSLGKGNAQLRDVAWLNNLSYNDVESRVSAALEEAYVNGKISAETYRGFAGSKEKSV